MTVRPFARKLVAALAAFGLAGHASGPAGGPHQARGLPARHQAVDGPRPAVGRRPGDVRRRHHPRRDHGGGHDPGQPGPRPPRRRDLPPGRRRRDRADGRASAARRSTVPVKVAQAAVQPPISFQLDVMPIFMRAGCNTGSCHGAARGKDGFRLSLFGYDPDGDHYRLTREMSGRRVNLAVPAESTAHREGHRRRPHTGGKRFEPASELYQTLLRWLEAGAPNDDVTKLPTVVGVELYPKHGGARRQGRDAADDRPGEVLRRHRPRRDPPGAVPDRTTTPPPPINPDGLVTAGDRGEAFVMARFATFTVGSQVIVLPKGLQVRVPSRARGQLHRHARRRQAEEAADRPVGPVHRRGLPPPRLPRHHRPACRRVEEYDRFMADDRRRTSGPS